MRNRYLEKWDRLVKVKITGNNIHRYLKRVIKDKIDIIQMYPVSRKEAHIILKYSDYEKLMQYRSIYEVVILQYCGSLDVQKKFRKSFVLLLCLCLGFFLIFFFSKIVFSVEVIHQDKDIRVFLTEELEKYGIKKYVLQKSYEELEKIEDQILSENKDMLEWIEIVSYGTKYTVRVEERKLNKKEEEYQYQHIVSKKNAVLVEIDAVRGEKVKFVNDYVSKGDVIISGFITLPNNTKTPTMAEGTVLGEVWYTVNVEYPFVYQETNFTGKSKTVYAIHFFDKRFGLFDFDEFHTFQSKEKVLFSSNFLDIRFVREKQYEVIIKDEVYTEEMVGVRAIEYVKEKLMKDNPSIREITDVKILNASSDEDNMEFKMFVKTIEDIGEVVTINKEELSKGDLELKDETD